MSDIPRYSVSQLAFGRMPPSRRRDDKVVMAMVLAPEREDAGNYYGSPDGDPKAVTNLPKKCVGHDLDGKRFALVTMPGWLVRERRFSQARQPGLCKLVKWTEEDREEWTVLRADLYAARFALILERNRSTRRRSSRDDVSTRYVSSGW